MLWRRQNSRLKYYLIGLWNVPRETPTIWSAALVSILTPWVFGVFWVYMGFGLFVFSITVGEVDHCILYFQLSPMGSVLVCFIAPQNVFEQTNARMRFLVKYLPRQVTYNCNWPWSTDCQGRPVLTGFIWLSSKSKFYSVLLSFLSNIACQLILFSRPWLTVRYM